MLICFTVHEVFFITLTLSANIRDRQIAASTVRYHGLSRTRVIWASERSEFMVSEGGWMAGLFRQQWRVRPCDCVNRPFLHEPFRFPIRLACYCGLGVGH